MSSSFSSSSDGPVVFCGADCSCGAFLSLRSASGDQVAPQPPCRLWPGVPTPGSVALCHTYNSRGELGAYVNPYACSCATCVDYVAQDSVPFGPQATEPALSSTTLEDMYREMGRVGLSNEAPAPAPSPAPSSLPQRSMGGGISLLGCGGGEEPSLSHGSFCAHRGRDVSAEEGFCDTLRSYRATLQIQSDDIGRGVERPTEAQLAQWAEEQAELDRKIQAIEACLLAFGSFFRTR